MPSVWPDEKSYFGVDTLRLLQSGSDYFDFLETLILSAKDSINFQCYIIEPDPVGKRIVALLEDAAKRGVEVNLLVDAFGSHHLPDKMIKSIEESGISFRRFSPLFSYKHIHFSRRLHHKVLVVDEQKAIIGGINIADRYCGSPTEIPWLDFAVYIEGAVCVEISKLCDTIWHKRRLFRNKVSSRNHDRMKGVALVKLRNHDWFRQRIDIAKSYKQALRVAQKNVIIVGSYFLPGLSVRRLMKKAVKRGVEIKIILSHLSDVPFTKRAGNFLYDWMLRNDIKIYEWGKSVVHGKVAVADGLWSTIGSYNLNDLSAYSSIETNLDILSPVFAKDFEELLQTLISEGCQPITQENHAKRGFFNSALDRMAYFFLRGAMRFYYLLTPKPLKRRKRRKH